MNKIKFDISKKNLILLIIYEILSMYLLYYNYRFEILLVSFMWFPAYLLIDEYSKILLLKENLTLDYTFPKNIRQFEEKLWSLIFYIPFIGPIIAIIRINYLAQQKDYETSK